MELIHLELINLSDTKLKAHKHILGATGSTMFGKQAHTHIPGWTLVEIYCPKVYISDSIQIIVDISL